MKHSAVFFAADDAVSVRPWRADVSGEKHPGEKKCCTSTVLLPSDRPMQCNGKYLSVQLQGLRIRDSEVEYIYDLNNINLSIKHMGLFHLRSRLHMPQIFFQTFALVSLRDAVF